MCQVVQDRVRVGEELEETRERLSAARTEVRWAGGAGGGQGRIKRPSYDALHRHASRLGV